MVKLQINNIGKGKYRRGIFSFDFENETFYAKNSEYEEIFYGSLDTHFLKINIYDDKLIIYTDLLGSFPLFYSNSGFLVSSEFLPNSNIDIVSIYDYLLNGVTHNGNTVCLDCKVFLADNIYIFENDKWNYIANNNVTYSSNNIISDSELKDSLLNSLSIIYDFATKKQKKILLSLSGGMDSASFLYGLRKFDVEFESFTYSNSKFDSFSDSSYAIKRSKDINIPISHFFTDNLSILELVYINAKLGCCVGKWCDEINVFNQNKSFFANTFVLGGDTYFLPKVEYESLDSLFNIVGYLNSFDSLFLKEIWINEDDFNFAFKGYNIERKKNIDRINLNGYDNIRDYVYWRFRLSTTLIWWRHRIQGSFCDVFMPYLFNPIFKIFESLSPELRGFNRSLYRSALQLIDSRIFSFGRAKTNSVPIDYLSRINFEKEAILLWLNNSTSLIDNYLDKNQIILLLSNGLKKKYSFEGLLYSLRHRSKMFNIFARIFKIPVKKDVKIEIFILRYLTLRKLYEN